MPKPRSKPKIKEPAFDSYEAALKSFSSQLGKPSHQWVYKSNEGAIVGYVVRFDPIDPVTKESDKTFRPISRYPEGWQIKAMPDPKPLYCLPQLAEARLVIVCEGEKAADAARSLGFVATTSAGGSQAAETTDWSPLAGEEVWILPDNDSPGRKYAKTVANILLGLDPTAIVKIIAIPGLPPKGDIVDWIKAHGDKSKPDDMRAKLENMAKQVKPEVTDPQVIDVEHFRPFPVEALPKVFEIL